MWGETIVSDGALTSHISELRQTLGDSSASPEYIETISKRGYRLIAPVAPPLDPDESTQTDPGNEAALDGTGAAEKKASRRRLTALGIVFLVVGLVAIWTYWPDDRPPPVLAKADGIAVLPFVNLSPDPDHAFFAGGMHEEVLTHLSHVGDLRVISRTSMEAIAAEGLTVPDIGRRLGVSHVLEGSVRRADNQVRVTAQLIEAATDAHLWADNYDRDLTDIFAIQSEIALAIVDELELSLNPRAAARLAERPTDNIEAYDLYLEGRERFRNPLADPLPGPDEVRDNLGQIAALFRAAIDKDPDFAAAHAALGYTLLSNMWQLSAEQAEVHYQAAVEASLRAIELEPDLAAGYLTLGKAYHFHGSGNAAWEQFRLAAEINPNDPQILRHLSIIHRFRGEHIDAYRLLRRATALDPEVPGYHRMMGSILWQLGMIDQARDAFRHAWEHLSPNPGLLNFWLSTTYIGEENEEGLREHIDQLTIDDGSPMRAGFAFRANIRLGHMDAAESLFDSHQEYFEQHRRLSTAQIWIHRGDHERAEQALMAYEQRTGTRIPRAWGSDLEVRLFAVEALRGRIGKALDHMETAVDKGFRGQLLGVFGHPDIHPPGVQEIAGHPRYRAAQDYIDAELARMRAELEELDASALLQASLE